MTYKEIFEKQAAEFTKHTGVKVEYIKQYGNGSYLWIDTQDNNGEGFCIGVNGYTDAYNVLHNMKMMFNIIKTGRV